MFFNLITTQVRVHGQISLILFLWSIKCIYEFPYNHSLRYLLIKSVTLILLLKNLCFHIYCMTYLLEKIISKPWHDSSKSTIITVRDFCVYAVTFAWSVPVITNFNLEIFNLFTRLHYAIFYLTESNEHIYIYLSKWI